MSRKMRLRTTFLTIATLFSAAFEGLGHAWAQSNPPAAPAPAGQLAASARSPKPDLAPSNPPLEVAKTWELEFTFHDPQRIQVQTADGGSETYWYLLYTVTNSTGKEVAFFPSVSLVTDHLEVIDAGAEVHPKVYDAIKARHIKEYPFFASPTQVTGPLLQGKPNSRTSAAVFKAFSPNANRFTLFTAGLSGDLKREANPAFNTSQPESETNPRYFLFRRTLAVTYQLPGDPQTRSQAAPIRVNREWVMR